MRYTVVILLSCAFLAYHTVSVQALDREETLSPVFDGHGVVMLFIDVETGAIHRANQAAAEFYGYSIEELQHMSIHDINTLSPAEVEAERMAAADQERNYFVFRHRRSDGELRTVEVRSYPITDGGTELFSIIIDITERVAAEQAVQDYNTRLKRSERVSKIGHWEIHLEDNTVRGSHGAQAIYGMFGETWAIDEVKKRALPQYRPMLDRALHDLVTYQKPYDVVYRIQRPANGDIVAIHSIAEYDAERGMVFGSLADITVYNQAISLAHRQRNQVIGMTIGIILLASIGAGLLTYNLRVRKQLIASLSESEYLLQQSQRLAHLGSWEIDVRTNQITWSTEVYSIFGWDPQDTDVTYDRVLETIHPEDREYVDRVYTESMANGSNGYEIDHRIMKLDTQEVRYTHAKCTHIKDSSGQVIRSVGMIHDITERKRAEEALQQSHDRLWTVLNSLEDAVYVMDMDTYEILFINAHARELWGDIVGRTCWKTIQEGQSGPCSFCTNDQLITEEGKPTGNVLRWEHRNTRNGRWYDCRDRAIEWIDGRVVRLEIENDITERKQLEEELQQYAVDVQLQRDKLDLLYKQLDREMDAARQSYNYLLQDDFPAIDNLSIAAFNKPATYIGGDFYKVVQKGSKLIVYVSDVTGHGLDGTMFSAFVRDTIEANIALVEEEDLSPEGILSFLDQRVRDTSREEEYAVALFLMVLDMETLTCQYSGVGIHNPPVVMRSQGQTYMLISEGLPIATAIPREAMNFHAISTQLEGGSTILLATDGLYEQLDADSVMYGRKAITLLQDHVAIDPQTTLDHLWEDFQQHRGSVEQADDVTVMILRVE